MKSKGRLSQSGRQVTADEISDAVEIVKSCGGLSRNELAHTLCEHWGWVTASGRHKVQACLSLLARLEEEGRLRLPATRKCEHPREKSKGIWTQGTQAGPEVVGGLERVRPVRLELVAGQKRLEEWKEYVQRYHPLGYKRPFGCVVRYFVMSERGALGCILLSGAALKIKERDAFIGWSEQQRLRNLGWVANNSRFLIFPWVQVKHLASHVLGQLARRVREDYFREHGYRPLMLETFVTPEEYKGTCYRAAGWLELGKTSGEGQVRPGKSYATHPKLIFVKPLVGDFREQLCSEQLTGRNPDEEWEEEGPEKNTVSDT